MRKFRLELEKLTVESFSPAAKAAVARGTVRGHADTDYSCGCVFTDNTCGGTGGTTLDNTVYCSYGDTGGCTCPREVGEG
jgi:hypothetical protein